MAHCGNWARSSCASCRAFAGKSEGTTTLDVLHAAEARFPALSPLLWEPDGSLSDYIKVFVDGREMRHLQGLATLVPQDAQLDIFPPAAGG